MGQKTPVQKVEGQPTASAMQPRHAVLTSLVRCFLWECHPEEAASNRSEQFDTNSLRRGQGTLVFYKFLIFFLNRD